jgi:hypothetical protein
LLATARGNRLLFIHGGISHHHSTSE